MMGSFPDAFHKRWRWSSFANCDANLKGNSREKLMNPCPEVASPISQAMFSGDDARIVWSEEFNIGYVDAFSVVHSSPTNDISFQSPDGLHPAASSSEVMAVNQLIMNTLCRLTLRKGGPIPRIRPKRIDPQFRPIKEAMNQTPTIDASSELLWLW